MKKLILILIILPLLIYCQDDFPEWEKIEFEGFSNSYAKAFEINNKNQLSLTLPTGVFISENHGEKWVKLNMPDSIEYLRTFINKNIIVSQGRIYDYNQTKLIYNIYIVVSFDYGINWKIIPSPDAIINSIDNYGNIWYPGEMNKNISIFKYDLKEQNFVSAFEIPKDFSEYHWFVTTIIKDSTIFAFFNDPNDYLYVFRSTNLGQSWDTLHSDNKGSKYFDYDEGGDLYGNDIVYANGKLYLTLSKGYMIIDIENKTYEVKRIENNFMEPYEILKKNESEFYSYTRRDENINFSIRYSKDSMKTWEDISYNLTDMYNALNVQIDSSDNLYIYDGSFYILRKGETKWINVKSTGLQYLEGGYFQVNSKSEILAYPYSPPYLMYYKDNEWVALKNPECDVIQPTQDIRFLPNDKLAAQTNCGFGITEYPLTKFEKIIVNDSLIINTIYNWTGSIQYNFLAGAYVQVNENKRNYYKLQSKDKCKTWEILEDFKFPQNSVSFGSFKFNKYDEFIFIGDSAKVYLSSDRGKSWKIVLDSSSNSYFNYDGSSISYYSTYNYQTGVGYAVYGLDYYGFILITQDHGRTWTTYTTESVPADSLFEFINEYHYTQNLNYPYYVNPEMITDYTLGYFYILTNAGVYRSTDSLHSFHCISKGQIEPSVITSLVLGYDGRLYALNYNGFWRTKTRVTSVENETKPEFSNSDIFIYPNPADEIINVKYDMPGTENQIIKYSLYNMFGFEVFRTEGISGQPIIIPTSNLTTGAYFLKAEQKVFDNEKNMMTKTVIIQR